MWRIVMQLARINNRLRNATEFWVLHSSLISFWPSVVAVRNERKPEYVPFIDLHSRFNIRSSMRSYRACEAGPSVHSEFI